MNSCDYNLTSKTTGKDGAEVDATISIACTTPGDHIVITGPLGCRVKIPAQTPTEGGVTYKNLPNHSGGAAIEVKVTVTGTTYTSEGFCGGIAAEGDNAITGATLVVTGWNDTEGLPTPVTEGARVGISVT